MTTTCKAIVSNYVERLWNRGDFAALDELTTPAFLYRIGLQPARSREETRVLVTKLRTAFPDWRVQIAEMIAEGDSVVIRWEGTVTHLGPFEGISATGKRIAVNGINLYHLVDGRIDSEWEQTHVLGWLQQMGVLPSQG